MMYGYTAYGLFIQSQFAIPELSVASGAAPVPDIRIRRAAIADHDAGDPTGNGEAHRLDASRILYVKDHCGRFLANDGQEIIVDPDPEVEDRVWRLSLFGPALGLILIQRGFLVLHGGAVVFPGGAALVLGSGGAGKSTLTAELCRQGGGLLTDDVVTIDAVSSPPLVMPGIPYLKLWPDAIAHAPAGSWTALLHPDYRKLGHRLQDSELASPSPIGRIYVLAIGDELGMDVLSGIDAFRALMASQFAARYGESFIAGIDGQDVLAKMTELLAQADVVLLRRPRDHGLLPETAAMIAADLGSNLPTRRNPPEPSRRHD